MSEFILFRGNVPMIARCIVCQGRGDISAKIVVGYRVEIHPTLGELQRCYCAAHAPEPAPVYLAPVAVASTEQDSGAESGIAERITLAIAALDQQQRIYTAREVKAISGVYEALLRRHPEQRDRINAAVLANKERCYLYRVQRAIALMQGIGPLTMTGILDTARMQRKVYYGYPAIAAAVDHAVLCSGGSLPSSRVEVA